MHWLSLNDVSRCFQHYFSKSATTAHFIHMSFLGVTGTMKCLASGRSHEKPCESTLRLKPGPFNAFPNDKFYTLPNSKSLQTTILNFMKMAVNSFKGYKNTAGKGEIARYEQFLRFPQCFQKGPVLEKRKKNQGLFGKGSGVLYVTT